MTAQELTTLDDLATDPLIRELVLHRRASEYTAEEFAALIGVSASTVKRFEAGRHVPKLSTVQRYAAALNFALVLDDANPT